MFKNEEGFNKFITKDIVSLVKTTLRNDTDGDKPVVKPKFGYVCNRILFDSIDPNTKAKELFDLIINCTAPIIVEIKHSMPDVENEREYCKKFIEKVKSDPRTLAIVSSYACNVLLDTYKTKNGYETIQYWME